MSCRSRTLVATAGIAVIILIAAAVRADDAPAAGNEDLRAAAIRHGAGSSDPSQVGIWKAVTPPAGSTIGEFDSNDPIGLSAGKKLKADCSINWTDADSGKRYCFLSRTSLAIFLETPHAYEADASAAWSRLNSPSDR